MYNDNRQHRRWIVAGCAFAMTINVTRHAPKLSLRGETLVSTRQSMCALATVVFDMWIAAGYAFAMTRGIQSGGERGIRTLDTLPHTRFPIVRLRPLGHLS